MPWLRLRKKANELCKFYLEELQLDHPEICYRSSLYVLTKPQASFQQGRDLPRNLFSTMKSVTGDTCPLAQLQKHHCSRSLCWFPSVLVKNNDFTIHVCYSTPEPGRSRATGKVVCGAAGIRDSGVLLCPAVSSSALEVVAVTHLDRGEKALASLEARPEQPPTLAPLATATASLLPSAPPLTVAACGLRREERNLRTGGAASPLVLCSSPNWTQVSPEGYQ